MRGKTNLKTALLISVFLLATTCSIDAGEIIYVDDDAPGGGNGQTWVTAYRYLQDALYKPPTSGDEIWVAEGTYKPDANTANPSGTGVREATFQLINGVSIYGGFAGGESSLDERDWQANETILSGDLKGDDDGFTNNSENSFHVVKGSGTELNAVLDGFTITAGNAANGGGVVDRYGGGMYNENCSPTVTNCTFSGNSAFNRGGGMYNYDSEPTVTNCTFSSNSVINGGGGGMDNVQYSSPTVTNCTFSGNSALYGGGIHNHWSSTTVTNCTFSENSANQRGGGMHSSNNSSPTVTNCTFSGNSANDDGGGMYNGPSNLTLTNCTFTGNTANNGGGMYNWTCNTTLINCTLSQNAALHISGGGGGINNYMSNPNLTNCILWGNTANVAPQIYDGDESSTTITYSDVEGHSSGTGNINTDPLFIDADGDDDIVGTEDDNLRLSSGSPCIDAGDNTAVPAGVTTDLDGNPRFVDEPATKNTGNGTPPIVDMGAYEYYPIYVDQAAAPAGNGCTWATAYKYLQDALADSAASGKDIYVAEGTYLPDANMVNPNGTGDRTATFQMVSGIEIYGGFPSGGGERNPDTYITILSGDLNGDDDGFTNNGENSCHVVTGSGTDPNAILDGFTITAGNADGFVLNERGGGIYNETGSPTIKNCIFCDNYANHGGGINNRDASYPLLIDCTFAQNSAGSNGGGIYNYNSGPTLLNCALYGNTSGWNGGGINNNNFQDSSVTTVINSVFSGNSTFNRGGGIFNLNNDCMVTNTSFYGNSAGNYGGAVASQSSDPVITNCVLWGNWDIDSTEQRGQVYTESGTLNINHSCVKGWDGTLGGVGNIGDDPLFKDADGDDDVVGTEDDNLELAAGSGCIDAGDNTAVPADTVDLDEDGNTSERTPVDLGGNARFTDDPLTDDTGVPATGYPEIVEMGAYERYEFCGDAGHPFPVGDVNRDCKVNFLDIAMIAAHWLEDAGPE